MTKSRMILALLLITSVQGCSSKITEVSSSNTQVTITSVEKELASVTTDLSCDASFQCKVLPLGERSCGGPSRFIIYSVKNNKQERVEQLGSEITNFENTYNQTEGSVESCRSTIQPQTLCINKKCEQIN